MSAQQYDALAAVERLLQVFEPVEPGDLRVRPVAGPAAEAHLDQRHAERLEVPRCQRVSLLCRQLRKTQLDVAADHGSAAAGNPLREPAEAAADRKPDTMWQQAYGTQDAHPEPGRPVTGRPEMMQWPSVVAHGWHELKRKRGSGPSVYSDMPST